MRFEKLEVMEASPGNKTAGRLTTVNWKHISSAVLKIRPDVIRGASCSGIASPDKQTLLTTTKITATNLISY